MRLNIKYPTTSWPEQFVLNSALLDRNEPIRRPIFQIHCPDMADIEVTLHSFQIIDRKRGQYRLEGSVYSAEFVKNAKKSSLLPAYGLRVTVEYDSTTKKGNLVFSQNNLEQDRTKLIDQFELSPEIIEMLSRSNLPGNIPKP